ncbi:transposase zinc-binding domain-containing protein [Paenibacillus sp. LHD-38]|uniref:transposase zinc-binding domain-containing protein n=1 Tax=Paenibacillus sp. LHD-38 TaxID=3072143 RepID=UPI00280EB13F|nr:transposase zinc-binding domain-containing protein [Paenibacillus sp. LHD-38]MDQ8733206.1 transposase zinc-binding domain-containing protein [Paenibacillus sp. LHD-38]
MDSNILKEIFLDKHQHWDTFVEKHKEHIRPNVLKEIQKFRGCGDPRNGFKILVCEGCHDIRRVPYRCKGRFCTTLESCVRHVTYECNANCNCSSVILYLVDFYKLRPRYFKRTEWNFKCYICFESKGYLGRGE